MTKEEKQNSGAELIYIYIYNTRKFPINERFEYNIERAHCVWKS